MRGTKLWWKGREKKSEIRKIESAIQGVGMNFYWRYVFKFFWGVFDLSNWAYVSIGWWKKEEWKEGWKGERLFHLKRGRRTWGRRWGGNKPQNLSSDITSYSWCSFVKIIHFRSSIILWRMDGRAGGRTYPLIMTRKRILRWTANVRSHLKWMG